MSHFTPEETEAKDVRSSLMWVAADLGASFTGRPTLAPRPVDSAHPCPSPVSTPATQAAASWKPKFSCCSEACAWGGSSVLIASEPVCQATGREPGPGKRKQEWQVLNKGRAVRGSGLVPETNFAYTTLVCRTATIRVLPFTVTRQPNWDTTSSSTIAQEVSAEVSGSRNRPFKV